MKKSYGIIPNNRPAYDVEPVTDDLKSRLTT